MLPEEEHTWTRKLNLTNVQPQGTLRLSSKRLRSFTGEPLMFEQPRAVPATRQQIAGKT
jgi:hypothetical protein